MKDTEIKLLKNLISLNEDAACEYGSALQRRRDYDGFDSYLIKLEQRAETARQIFANSNQVLLDFIETLKD